MGDLTVKAKLIIHRGGQAVRLPDEFRFEGTEVHVRRVGDEVVLSSVQPPTADALIDALMAFEMDAGARRAQPAEQERCRRITVRISMCWRWPSVSRS